MKINKETKLWDVIKAFNWKWCVVTLKNGKRIKLYIVDVDYEAFGYNIIVYNGNDIPFSDIDEIELYKSEE